VQIEQISRSCFVDTDLAQSNNLLLISLGWLKSSKDSFDLVLRM